MSSVQDHLLDHEDEDSPVGESHSPSSSSLSTITRLPNGTILEDVSAEAADDVDGVVQGRLAPSRKRYEDRGENGVVYTFFLIMKSYIGSGLLGMPYAFAHGGVPAGVIVMVLAGAISLYTISLLLRVKERVNRRPGVEARTFRDVGFYAMKESKVWKRLVAASICYTQVGFSVAYVIFIASTVAALVNEVLSPVARLSLPAPNSQASRALWTVILGPAFAATVLIKRLRFLSPFAMVAFWAIVVACSVVLGYCINEQLIDWGRMETVNIGQLPIFFSIAVYAFEGIGVAIPLQEGMREPARFERTLLYAYILLVFLCAAFGSLAYVSFGKDTKDIVIFNLQPGAWYTVLSQLLLIFGLFWTYPLQLVPVVSMAENAFPQINRNVVRLLVALVTLMLACAIPHFAIFIALIGSIGSVALMFVFPVVFHVATFRTSVPKLVFHVTIAVIAFLIGVVSFFQTITKLVALIQNHEF